MIHLTPEQRIFTIERHLATLATLRADGSPHVTPVGFTWDADHGWANITTMDYSVKVRNASGYADGAPRAALCQVDGGRWITLEGTIAVVRDPQEIELAVANYTKRYSAPEPNPARIVLRLTVDNVMSSDYMAR
ncbi:TIGR03618 family F420-dependent PPOX class oxidoreductase [Jonesiaceae bacterium BS-20]|uniref:TIGR03618 family F420-dependent PPOX class oxidoreductase n=1 Tax=Jonesiaceae bacterium BS-20 TaxID=3120821 RepID=A0AAU7DY01_9MICO